jgi:hypothetical protein
MKLSRNIELRRQECLVSNLTGYLNVSTVTRSEGLNIFMYKIVQAGLPF